MTPLPKATATRGTALFLIAVNLIPLAGVLFWNWSLFQIVALYWLENVVIGIINLLKMAVSSPSAAVPDISRPVHDQKIGEFGRGDKVANNVSKFFLMPFFTVHYGLFCAVHGMFVAALLGKEALSPGRGFFGELPALVSRAMADGGLLAAAGLTISHLVSFLHHFMIRGEYRRTSAPQLMAAPYGRIVVLHLAILLGGFLIHALGSPLVLLVILIAGKIVLDLKLHVRAHTKAGAASAGAGAVR